MIQWVVLFAIGVIFWLITLIFFRYLGAYVLLSPDEPHFLSFLLLLLTVTLLLLVGISLLVRLRMYRVRGAATRFGYWTALSGLVLNAFVIWHRQQVFPDFSEQQQQAFAVCITFASALILLIPMFLDRIIPAPPKKYTATVPAAHPPMTGASGAGASAPPPPHAPVAEPSVPPSSSTFGTRGPLDK